MSELIKEIEDKRALNSILDQKVAALASAQNEILSLETRLPVLEQALPSDPQLLEALSYLEKIASDQQLIIENLTLATLPKNDDKKPTPTQARQSYTLNFTIRGDYVAIKNYLDQVLNVRRAFIIESVSFNTTDTRGKKNLKANVTLAVPYITKQ